LDSKSKIKKILVLKKLRYCLYLDNNYAIAFPVLITITSGHGTWTSLPFTTLKHLVVCLFIFPLILSGLRSLNFMFGCLDTDDSEYALLTVM
jgi:hypothetical protein